MDFEQFGAENVEEMLVNNKKKWKRKCAAAVALPCWRRKRMYVTCCLSGGVFTLLGSDSGGLELWPECVVGFRCVELSPGGGCRVKRSWAQAPGLRP